MARAAISGVADGPDHGVNDLLARVPLIDHHAHSIVAGKVSPAAAILMLNESGRPAAAALSRLDSQVGIAIRRWCAPLLGWPAHLPADDYLTRRSGMANEDAAALLLPAAGFERLVIDTGYRADTLVALDGIEQLAGAPTSTVIRLEALAEGVARSISDAASFVAAFRAALHSEAATAVGFKSIIAYRFGLDFDPEPPSETDVTARAGAWLADIAASGNARLVDPVVLRFVLWEGARQGKPLQVHTGYGDPDLDLRRADPLLMTDFLRATEGVCPVLLLHTYPFHRNAGYLAQMFSHVYVDIGLAINYTGAQSPQVIAEALEVAPFTKILFSSDAWGLPELHLLGSWLFRRGMARVIGSWVERGDWSAADAERVIRLIAAENARRVYGLVAGPTVE